jgi:threonine dehydrogenase-like Zn-dependent dehydrogenase
MLKAKPAPGENAVVFGAGIIGLGVVQCVRALEIELGHLVVVDVSDRRLEVARELGADATINAARENPDERLRDLLGTTPIGFQPAFSTPAVDIVYDCVGYIRDRPEPQVIEQAMALVRASTGRIVVHGVFEDQLTLNLLPMVAKEISILGSYGFQPPEVAQAMELMRARKVDREGLISHAFPLDRAHEAFEAACDVEESVKVLLKP